MIDVEIDGGGAYLDYTFITDDADVVRFLTNDNNNGVHLYGITNEMVPSGMAIKPVPVDKATDVYRQAVLSWGGGDGDRDARRLLGLLRSRRRCRYFVRSQRRARQRARRRPPSTRAVSNWARPISGAWTRSAEPGLLVTKGMVWSFTVEPVSYAIAGGFGYSHRLQCQHGQHGTGQDRRAVPASVPTILTPPRANRCGLAPMNDPQPWIQYAFDRVYKFDKMLVWNSNQAAEPAIGWGVKAATIEVSLDGQTWTRW